MKVRKKRMKSLIIFLFAILGLLIILIVTSALIYSPTYMYRIITNIDSSISDYKIFPNRVIDKGGVPYSYAYSLNNTLSKLPITYAHDGHSKESTLSDLIEQTDTTSFIILQDDKIVYEQYANGYNKDSINTSFSMVKSIDSLLIGKAIEDGYIKSEDQSIAEYIDEFKGTPLEHITIRELLLMRSDIVYDEGLLWFGDDSLTYWMPDLRKLALSHREQAQHYNGNFHYNNYHPLLLGIILERSTGMSVSTYFEQQIWQKIGAQHEASWSLDSESSGFEKMESGLNFRSLDFIKIGSMMLHNGNWNGEEIINQDWIAKSTVSNFPINSNDYVGSFLEDKNIGYQYMWYTLPDEASENNYFAWGKYGQVLYISPSRNIVILRTGKSDGDVDVWPELINSIACEI